MLNIVTIAGRFTKEPEMKTTQNGTPICSFSLAVERDLKGQDGKRSTDFFDCLAWRQTAEFVSKTFHRGDGATVMGRLQNRQYEKDGAKHARTEIVVEKVYFQLNRPDVVTKPDEEDPDDLPF